jgi:2-(1,2-epoxy-1,2-dihydrophenyl)acetyl-CoA isomerase
LSDLETILVQKNGNIEQLTLNRPNALNAINETMGDELLTTLKQAAEDSDVRCVVITGAGRAFSAGEDVQGLRERYGQGKHPSLGDHLRKKYHPIILAIRNMEKPVIASLNGIAAGSGASIALACDFRIASEEAGLKQAFIGMALVPDSGSSYFLIKTLGIAKALELIMSGKTIKARDAKQLGLITEVVSASELNKTVNEFATHLAEGPTKALGYSKRIVNRVSTLSLEDALEYEAEHQDIAGRTVDHLEAVNAFLDKREPKFVGK